MKHLFVACDHAGFELKKKLLSKFKEFPWVDLGTDSDESVDYPDYAEKLAAKMKDPQNFGLLICGSGQGMCIKANRYPQVRAALCWTEQVAQLAREHNDANVLCLPGRLVEHELCANILKRFLETPFAGGRHQQRVDKLKGP